MMFDCVAARERASTRGWVLALSLGPGRRRESESADLLLAVAVALAERLRWLLRVKGIGGKSGQCRYGLACAHCVSVSEIEPIDCQAARRQFGRSMR